MVEIAFTGLIQSEPSLNPDISDSIPISLFDSNVEEDSVEVDEEEKKMSYELISRELRSWCEACTAVIGFLFLLQLHELFSTPIDISLIPQILREFRIALTETLALINAEAPREKFIGNSLIKSILYRSGNIASHILCMLYLRLHSINFLLVGIIPAITTSVMMFIPGGKKNKCDLQSLIVILT